MGRGQYCGCRLESRRGYQTHPIRTRVRKSGSESSWYSTRMISRSQMQILANTASFHIPPSLSLIRR
jgi:hypothetical protein